MSNKRVIQVRTLPVTNTRGLRIKLTESRFNKTDSKTIPFDYEESYTLPTAIKYLKSIGINVVGYGEFKDAYYIFSDSWANGEGFINIKGEKEL